MLSLSNLIRLINVSRERNRSQFHYFKFQQVQGELLVDFILANNIRLTDKLLLDLGSGYGGYSSAFQKSKACVIALDLNPINYLESIDRVKADANMIPAPKDKFDVVICTSLIEHVPEPGLLLGEIWRVLKRGGYLILSFPPYYSPVGGHQFAPFHLLGQNIALQIARKRNIYRNADIVNNIVEGEINSFSNAFGNWGLYPLTIRKIKKEIHKSHFIIIKQATRYLPLDISKIPFLGEFLTWHIQFILRKNTK